MSITIEDDEANFASRPEHGGIGVRMIVRGPDNSPTPMFTVVPYEMVAAHVGDGYATEQAIRSIARGQIMEQAARFFGSDA